MGGAVARLVCDPGFALAEAASSDIYCDSASWRPRRGPPECRAVIETRKTSCDFETEDLCGWEQDSSMELTWIRNNYSTPSGYMQTGPSFDHTFGEGFGGHYLYIESSSPRKENDIARLYSPVYSKDLAEDGCFVFWYNMYGINTGFLRVFVKPQSQSLNDLEAAFQKSGNQGPRWIQGMISLSSVNESFQVIIEAKRGNGYLGDSAIDDVALRKGSDCVIIPDQPITAAIRQDTEPSTEKSSRGQPIKSFPTFLPAPPLPELPPMPPGPDVTPTTKLQGSSGETQAMLPLTLGSESPRLELTTIPQITTNSKFGFQVTVNQTLSPKSITNATFEYATSTPLFTASNNGTEQSLIWSTPGKRNFTITSDDTYDVTTAPEPVKTPSTLPILQSVTNSNTSVLLSTLSTTSKGTAPSLSTATKLPAILPTPITSSTKTTQRPIISTSLRTTITSSTTSSKRPIIRKITLMPIYMKTETIVMPYITTTTAVPTTTTTRGKTTISPRLRFVTTLGTIKMRKTPITLRYLPIRTTTENHMSSANTPTVASPATTGTKRTNYRVFQRVVKPVSAPANKAPTFASPKNVIIILVITLMLLLIAVLAFFVVRKRLRLRMQRNVAEDSDVRFLTSDEILDFNLAKPADDEA